MKKSILIGILLTVILMSCSKSNTGAWSGTYNGTVSGTANINRVVISQSGNNLQMQLQVESAGAYYTYVTIQNATVSGTTATIDEDGLIYGYTGTYHFAGTAQLSGDNLTVSGSGTNTTNASDIKLYYFTGSK
jgi:heat shock protein HslJ